MHGGNHLFLDHIKAQYPESFVGARVLELGALDICGTVRKWFERCQYVGVDVVAGPGVDVVTPAMHTSFEKEEFDTLISFSMFEHDATWERSYAHNIQWLKPGGMIFMCWGAEGNPYHPPDPFAVVTVAQFNEANARIGCVEVLDQFFEMERFPCRPGFPPSSEYGDCAGCYDVVARKLR